MEKEKEEDISIKIPKTKEVLAIMSYLWVLCLIPLVFGKSKFVKFHAKQGLVLFFIEVILSLIPIIGWFFIIVPIVLSILGIKSVLREEMWEIPYINKISKKINL